MARIGLRYNAETDTYEDVEDDFEIAEVVIPSPPISDRQFFHQLAIDGRISEAEALAAVATGTLPAAVETIVSGLSSVDQFSARMLMTGATSFHRDHPLVIVFATAIGMDADGLDEFWSAASEL
ncbi:hypothetical protein [Allorhizobium borbori]|uniref:Uncharacterized protein n=1 Tax=Allorhizobium borbori TaxID=485907 RepID=A0A7W6P119_9HYPH|nr:hypothetical protein [Allorhizobium borbori]MBB4102396.1 hypothetical protein [Allorhizobium borbori]